MSSSLSELKPLHLTASAVSGAEQPNLLPAELLETMDGYCLSRLNTASLSALKILQLTTEQGSRSSSRKGLQPAVTRDAQRGHLRGAAGGTEQPILRAELSKKAAAVCHTTSRRCCLS